MLQNFLTNIFENGNLQTPFKVVCHHAVVAHGGRLQHDSIFGGQLSGIRQFLLLQHRHEVTMFIRKMFGVNAAQAVFTIQLQPGNKLFILPIKGVE